MKLEDKKIYCFADALYKGECSDCKEELSWEADFDADGTVRNAYCCNNHYSMYTNTVNIYVEPFEDEDDEDD